MIVPITHRNRFVGVAYTDEQKYLSKRTPEHFMGIFQGFGISEAVIDRLWEMGVRHVFIEYEGKRGKKTYYARLSDYSMSEKWYTFEEEDTQRFLSIKDMKEVTDPCVPKS
jgi:hypothetical protein